MNKRKHLDQKKRKRQNILLALMLAVIAFALFGRFIFEKDKKLDPAEIAPATELNKVYSTTTAPTMAHTFPVHVAGAVNKPGIYYFTEGVIVSEAIDKAGGQTTDAASDILNLAQLLNPHAKLYVPTREEVEAGEVDLTSGGVMNDSRETTPGKINLNLATEADLLTVPGIGPATASAILKYREMNGKFSQLEDLMQVSGIKDKKFASLEPYLYIP
ncbi:MAG: hypothetical protein GX777_05435 [Fastidiosipila sp.]|nr:hypothetical protein [Fastidiosipila sp.]